MSNNELIKAAAEARRSAYAPYSRFTVGAALATGSGKIFTGCNVENVSFGLTICAERSAVAAAIAAGSRDFVSIAVVSGAKQPAAPCGACRQVLAEFNPNMKILTAAENGAVEEFELSQLLPKPLHGILKKDGDV